MNPIIYIVIIVLLLIASPVIAKSKRYRGLVTPKELMPYYNKVLYYIEPYLNCSEIKKLDENIILLLKDIYKNNNCSDGIYKEIINKANDSDYVYSFSWLFIYSFLKNSNPLLKPSREELSALNHLKNRIKTIIIEEKNNIPENLFNFFDINGGLL